MLDSSTLARVGAMVGDPGRARMLSALLDGRALTASELAAQAGVSPPTASEHLAKLLATGLIVMRRQGRHRYHELASADVAGMLETMAQMAPATVAGRTPVRVGPREAALRAVRSCYDHLAGHLAVGLADAMAQRGHIDLDRDGGLVTPAGMAFLQGFGIDLGAARKSHRIFCRPCLDWSERRPHLAGAVGAALLRRCLDRRWLRRLDGTRALAVTVGGESGFREEFGVVARYGTGRAAV
ncbi:MAG TPA: winged helix-turn-helix domain-containing protein [Vicinamibacteria bacterium]|nr:winged helix-turn-helix domain-containing protein [Vicinamibacteria bacterium]